MIPGAPVANHLNTKASSALDLAMDATWLSRKKSLMCFRVLMRGQAMNTHRFTQYSKVDNANFLGHQSGHGMNTSVLHRWLKEWQQGLHHLQACVSPQAAQSLAFITIALGASPLSLSEQVPAAPADNLHRMPTPRPERDRALAAVGSK